MEDLTQYDNKFVVYLITFPNGKKYCGYSSNKEEALKKEYDIIEELDLLNTNKSYNLVPGGGDPPHGLKYVSKEGYEKIQANGKRLANEIWNNPEKAEYCIQRMREETHKARMQMTIEERKESYGKHNIGNLPPNSKSIYQIDKNTNEIINKYESARRAAIAIGNASYGSNIRRIVNGKGQIAYGYKWRWANE